MGSATPTTKKTNASSSALGTNTFLAKKELMKYRPSSSILTNKIERPETSIGGKRFRRRMNMSV